MCTQVHYWHAEQVSDSVLQQVHSCYSDRPLHSMFGTSQCQADCSTNLRSQTGAMAFWPGIDFPSLRNPS